jgi:RNA polymerase sigma-70 factor, ECF subfamily
VSESDAELTRAAQSGDVVALGLLLARHRPGMRAVALSLLGYSPDADDAVQDASLVALLRIGDVRDPAAVGPWLRMIVRNACRTRLRSVGELRFATDLASSDATPDQVLDNHALRDWIWDAIEKLSPSLRMVMLLRHFSSTTSYQQIALACALPVGTVRSRLSQGRAKLADALLATADSAHGDAAILTAASRHDAFATLISAERGDFAQVLADRWAPDVLLLSGGRPVGGRDLLLRGMECDLEAGVHQRVANVIASRDIVIWEMDLLNPADDPEHCPPAVTWLMSVEKGRVKRLRLYHPHAPGTVDERMVTTVTG